MKLKLKMIKQEDKYYLLAKHWTTLWRWKPVKVSGSPIIFNDFDNADTCIAITEALNPGLHIEREYRK